MEPRPRLRAALAVMLALLAACGSALTSSEPDPRSEPSASATRRQGPTLHIRSPRPGDRVLITLVVRYEIRGVPASALDRWHLHLFQGDPDGYVIEVPLRGPAGVVHVDDKMLPGHRDLTFAIARADHTLLPGPGARVTVPGVTVEGVRDAGG